MSIIQTLNTMAAASSSMEHGRQEAERSRAHRKSMQSSRSSSEDTFDPYATVYGNQRMSKVNNATKGAIVPRDEKITGFRNSGMGGDTLIYSKKIVPANLSAHQFPA